MRCGSFKCRKTARYFGRFVGGICEEHAVALEREFPGSLHPVDKLRLEQASFRRSSRPGDAEAQEGGNE